MNRTILSVVSLVVTVAALHAQTIAGTWQGRLPIAATGQGTVPVVIDHIDPPNSRISLEPIRLPSRIST